MKYILAALLFMFLGVLASLKFVSQTVVVTVFVTIGTILTLVALILLPGWNPKVREDHWYWKK